MRENTNNIDPAPDVRTIHMMTRLMRSYVKKHTGHIGVAIFFMAIAAAMTAVLAQLMQPILDDVLSGEDTGMIVPIGLAVFGTFLLRGVSTYIHVIIMNKVGHSIIADLQKDLFAHFMRLDLTFFHAHPSGQLISRVMNDVSVVRRAIADSLTALGKNLLTLIFLIGVMVYQDWVLAIACFGVAPFIAFFIAYIGRRLRKVSKRTQNEMAGLSDRLSQIFQGIRQVQAYGMEKQENARAFTAIDSVRDLNIKAIKIGNMSTPVNEVLIGIVASSIIVYGGFQVADGQMSMGQLVSFLTAFTMAYEPMKKLARLNNTIQTGLGAAERVLNMLDTPTKIESRVGAQDVTFDKPRVVFDDVVFHYGETGEDNALDGISFSAEAGKVTALVGESGGGKSTIINLIPRFYDVTGGALKLDDHDVRDITISSLRDHIALVSQDITMFDDSIAANIAYGRAGATQDQIEEAAKKAAADEFIKDFPQGYETRVGEDGVKLSGGQKQRIAIARALLRDAPILLLDEATSALDNESERLVQAALDELEKGRTTIVIAHRLSTVKQADKIIVLEKGRIAESGSHDDLMANNGVYARMVHAGLRE